MRVLVTAASKYGSTWEMAETIGEVLQEHGLETEVARPVDVGSVGGFDAVVFGSAVYAGRWQKDAKQLLDRAGPELAAKRVWLFSSGPLGDPPKPEEEPVDVADILEATGAEDHRVFAGKLVRKQLNFGEKALVMALRAPEGDFRDWNAIRSWAGEIAQALRG